MNFLNLTVNDVDVPEIEYQQERVLPFKLIDQIHGRPDGTAWKRFDDNKKYFIENEDFFLLSNPDFRGEIWQNFGFKPQAAKGILLTKSGYLLLVKSFTDELAWEVQRKLIDGYFVNQVGYLNLKTSDYSANLKEIRTITLLLPSVTDALVLNALCSELKTRHAMAGMPPPNFKLLGKDWKQMTIPGFDNQGLEDQS